MISLKIQKTVRTIAISFLTCWLDAPNKLIEHVKVARASNNIFFIKLSLFIIKSLY